MPLKGFKHSKKSKIQISKTLFGRKITWKHKISQALKGKKRLPFSKKWKKNLSLALKGKKRTEKTKEKLRKYQGSRRYNWKGEKVKYKTLHNWIRRHLGKANHCEDCGLDKIPKGRKTYFQWANISKKYKRDLKDFKQLCVKCHKIYDRKRDVSS